MMQLIYQVDKILRMQLASAKSYQPGKLQAWCVKQKSSAEHLEYGHYK